MQVQSDYISIGKAAKMIGCSVDTLRRWEREGKIFSTRYVKGGNRMFLISEISKLMKRGRNKNG